MASSRANSSPGRRNSGSQLLQELEALSQSLYKSQQVTMPRRAGSLSFPTARESSRSNLIADIDEAIPLPGLVSAHQANFMPPNVSKNMRHSIAHPQEHSYNDRRDFMGANDPTLRARYSTSAATMNTSSESVDIRGRKKRHSLSPWRFHKDEQYDGIQNSNIRMREDQNAIDFSRKLDGSADKTKGFWNWKPIRALSHIGMHRFSCLFSVHVNAIEGLPTSMNGLRVAVHLRKKETKEGAVQTMASRVFQTVAEIEETLHIKCHVYGSKSGSQGFKFQSRPFIISVIAVDAGELDFGKHQLDLSLLLQETVEKQAAGEECNGWNTSFELYGKARGAELAVGLAYEFLDKDAQHQIGNISARFNERRNRRTSQSLPNSARGTPRPFSAYQNSTPSRSSANSAMIDFIRMDHLNLDEPSATLMHSKTQENLNARSDSDISSAFDGSRDVGSEYSSGFQAFHRSYPQESMLAPSTHGVSDEKVDSTRKLWSENTHAMAGDGGNAGDDEGYFEVVEQGVEIQKSVKDEGDAPICVVEPVDEQLEKEGDAYSVEIIKEVVQEANERTLSELDSIVQQISALESKMEKGSDEAMDKDGSPDRNTVVEDLNMAARKDPGNSEAMNDVMKGTDQIAVVLDDEADLVAGEFLHMLENPEIGPTSQKNDKRGSDVPVLNLSEVKNKSNSKPSEKNTKQVKSHLGSQSSGWKDDDEVELASILKAAESELERATQSFNSKTRAKLLEDAETEALMQEWGLNEKMFQNSPPESDPMGFHNSVLKNQLKLPDLGDGLGSVVQTRDGGMLASMDPVHFQSGSGRLVMQVSKPIVVPADMGYNAVEILQKMAAMGPNNLTAQALACMPLDDITGKTMEQIAFEGMATAITKNGYSRRPKSGSMALQTTENIMDECVSLESLAPLAVQKIEAMAMEGLKLQAEMAEEEAPYNVFPVPLPKQQNGNNDGGVLKGTSGLQTLLADTNDANSKGLMDMAVSLEEWMKLDAGLYDEEKSNENTRAILAAHHARHRDLTVTDNQKNKPKKNEEKGNSINGVMGNSLTIALLVQLRDPFRNNEAVGSPMIALVHAERVSIPSKPNITKTISMNTHNEDDEDEDDSNQSPRFKIKGVHMSGLKMQDDQKKSVWSSEKQHQTGSKWLIANGMAKNARHSLL
eukprot:Gb_31963 [translate_table: standard]